MTALRPPSADRRRLVARAPPARERQRDDSYEISNNLIIPVKVFIEYLKRLSRFAFGSIVQVSAGCFKGVSRFERRCRNLIKR
ncbi:hypothetical protein EVAR_45456_1 [Eumeta japonica]|uniref:Uncharacterized protein n=1 Tax=Eumeta variegata TaxID=151549 RepID=A0A4C1YGH2_EUMVA|nr:hypothetical protein EVAR_45456_1 [Eumeta japonica]